MCGRPTFPEPAARLCVDPVHSDLQTWGRRPKGLQRTVQTALCGACQVAWCMPLQTSSRPVQGRSKSESGLEGADPVRVAGSTPTVGHTYVKRSEQFSAGGGIQGVIAKQTPL
eukprot:133633-Chlamydomonas_euryale.AAC.2